MAYEKAAHIMVAWMLVLLGIVIVIKSIEEGGWSLLVIPVGIGFFAWGLGVFHEASLYKN